MYEACRDERESDTREIVKVKSRRLHAIIILRLIYTKILMKYPSFIHERSGI